MKVRYRNFTHPVGEAAISTASSVRRDENDVAVEDGRTYLIAGRLIADTHAELLTMKSALEAAYASDYGDLALLEDDGTVVWQIRNQDTAKGILIDSAPSFPDGGETNAQWSTFLDYRISIKAAFPISTRSGLISSRQSVRIIGDGGPEIIVREYLNGKPQVQQVRPFTSVIVIQQGEALSYGNYAFPAKPVYPQFLQRKRSGLDYDPPPRLSVLSLDPNKNVFRIGWNYYMELPEGTSGRGFRS